MSTDTPDDKTPGDKTSPQDTVALAVEKITAALAQGDQVSGRMLGKDGAEMKTAFNEAGARLGLPVINLAPLQGGTKADIQKDLGAHMLAFRQAAAAPVLIVYDSAGHQKLKISNKQGMEISNFIGSLTERFPKAVYVQVIADERYAATPEVHMYCMNPKTPRDPNGPIYPV